MKVESAYLNRTNCWRHNIVRPHHAEQCQEKIPSNQGPFEVESCKVFHHHREKNEHQDISHTTPEKKLVRTPKIDRKTNPIGISQCSFIQKDARFGKFGSLSASNTSFKNSKTGVAIHVTQFSNPGLTDYLQTPRSKFQFLVGMISESPIFVGDSNCSQS